MPVSSVIGTQWGDEGKGKILDLMAEQADLVVRFQGGANAGHTVVVGEETFKFHLLPSGILHEGKRNLLGNGMVIDPAQLQHEVSEFQGRLGSMQGRLLVSAAAHLVFPYHKALDVASEGVKGGVKIGTTGRGIGPAYGDKASRIGIRVGELFKTDRFRARLEANVREKNRLLTAIYDAEALSFEEILEEYLGYAEFLKPYVVDSYQLLQDALRNEESVFLEGAQGILLDLDFGTYPYVTSSNSSTLGIPAGTGIAPRHVGHVVGVAKAYCTRVGEGPFPTELQDEVSEHLRDKGHEFGTTTGRPRRCGWFDAVAARFAVEVNGIDSLAVTKLDTLAGLPGIKVCTAYEVDGQQTDRFPVGLTDLSEVTPVYQEFEGFAEEIDGVRRFEDLPAAARNYVSFLEDHLHIKAGLVSVGPARAQSIHR